MCSESIQIKGNSIVAVDRLSRVLLFDQHKFTEDLSVFTQWMDWSGFFTGPGAQTDSSGSCCFGVWATRGGHKRQSLVHLHCFSGAGGEVLQFDILAFIAFRFCAVSHRSCLHFWKGLILLRGVKKLSPLFSGFRHIPLFLCVWWREEGLGRRGNREKSVYSVGTLLCAESKGTCLLRTQLLVPLHKRRSITVSG